LRHCSAEPSRSAAPAVMSDDPSQSAAQAAGRQDRAAQEKWRQKIQEGALTGYEERNTKWDVEYEGKDAAGTLVRPFEPGYGDARRLPEKMMGETIRQAQQRSMGRDVPHSGMGDGKKVFKTDADEARLKKMVKEEAEKDGVGRHFTKDKPKTADQLRTERHLAKLNRQYPNSPVMKNGTFDNSTSYSRASPQKDVNTYYEEGVPTIDTIIPRSRDKPLRSEGAHAMLDRMGPNIVSNAIPRDGFTTDAYEELTRQRLHEMGWSDILGETAERPDELDNGIDHLDKLEHVGKSEKDLMFSAGFTGNEKLYTAKLDVSHH